MKAHHKRYSTAILIPLFDPTGVIRITDNIRENTEGDYKIYFISNNTDCLKDVSRTGASMIYSPVEQYAHMINVGYQATKETYIVTASENLGFHENWLEKSSRELSNGIEVIGLNPVEHIEPRTFLIKRRFLKEYGGVADSKQEVFYEGYRDSSFAFREFLMTAKHRGVYGFSLSARVEHIPPVWQLEQTSDKQDEELYESRKRLWEWLQP